MDSTTAEQVAHWCKRGEERLLQGQYEAAQTFLQAAYHAAGAQSPPNLLRALGVVTAELDTLPAGLSLLQQALAGFRLRDDLAGEVQTAGDIAACEQRTGDLGCARSRLEWALTQVGAADPNQARLLFLAATTAALQGRLDVALDLTKQAHSVAPTFFTPWVWLVDSLLYGALYQHDQAAWALEQASSTANPDDSYVALWLNYGAAWQALGQHDYDAAQMQCQKALRRTSTTQHPVVAYLITATVGVVARETGDFTAAEQALTQAQTESEQHGDHATGIGILWHRAVLAQGLGDGENTASFVEQALATMHDYGYGTTLLWQPSRFRDVCMWAVEHAIADAHAQTLLETTLAPRACAIMQPPSDPTQCQRYLDALTEREQHMLTLVAQGLRDQEIATILCLSVRTVNNHLQNIYAKLGVSNRTAALIAWENSDCVE